MVCSSMTSTTPLAAGLAHLPFSNHLEHWTIWFFVAISIPCQTNGFEMLTISSFSFLDFRRSLIQMCSGLLMISMTFSFLLASMFCLVQSFSRGKKIKTFQIFFGVFCFIGRMDSIVANHSQHSGDICKNPQTYQFLVIRFHFQLVSATKKTFFQSQKYQLSLSVSRSLKHMFC